MHPHIAKSAIVVSIVIVGLAALSGCSSNGNSESGASPSPETSPAGNEQFLSDAREYCESSDGELQWRQPTLGTNNDQSTWVALGEPVELCQFRKNDDGYSQISLDLVTLYSDQPTLAAVAFLAKTPVPTDGSVNPAYLHCQSLGGASTYGNGIEGGGLFLEDATEEQLDVISMCTFADGSMIDDWGISYHSNDIVRGTDLTELFRFDVEDVPHIFQGSTN